MQRLQPPSQERKPEDSIANAVRDLNLAFANYQAAKVARRRLEREQCDADRDDEAFG
jgi:hypothetical protein